MVNVGVRNGLGGGIALRGGIKNRAPVDIRFGRCQCVQQAFRVGAACRARHTDQCRGAGKGFKAAAPPAGTQRGIGRIGNYHVSGLGCCAGVAGQQLSAQHNARTDAGAERQNHRALRPLGAACQCFAEGSHIGIVAEADWQPGFGLQVVRHSKIVPVEIVGIEHHAVTHRAGAAHADAGDRLPRAELQTQRGYIVTDLLRRAGQVGGGGGFLYNFAAFAYKGGLDVGAAQVNAQIIHKKILLRCPSIRPASSP